METLSELHFDRLSNIINVGTGRAAQGLSEVIGESIQASAPNVELIQLKDASVQSLRLDAENFGVVTQEFMGALNAEVMLLFPEEQARRIVKKMMGAEIDVEMLLEFENEALCELGNIMINACLASITDMLHISVQSSLPTYVVKSNAGIAEQIKNESVHDFVLASHIDFVIEGQPAEGKLFFLMRTSVLG